MKVKCLFFFLSIFNLKYSQPNYSLDARVELITDYIEVAYEGYDFSSYIYVGVNRQKLYHVKNGSLLKIYDVSTALNGAGNDAQSFKTPIGLHEIHEKIGNDLPIGALFKHKHFTGDILQISADTVPIYSVRDAITTRIMTLKGLENGVNFGSSKYDTKYRGIYIHGTNEEELIGKPASHGCIRMRNTEIIELFNAINIGCIVVVLDN